ncbi:hypothetical protein [Streptomyces sp. NPDC002276]
MISSPGYRYDIAVVSAPADAALSGRIDEGRSVLAEGGAPGRGRLVVYGEPRGFGPEVIRDTAYLYVEELAEILADAEGDPSLPALFVLNSPNIPGLTRSSSRSRSTRGPIGGAIARCSCRARTTRVRPSFAPAAGSDATWQRAVTWARLDDTLAAAGLPQGLDRRFAQLAEPDPGVPGEQQSVTGNADSQRRRTGCGTTGRACGHLPTA